MKLKNTTIKLGLLFLITIGLTGCFVLGNHDEADRIDNILELRFNSMSMIDYVSAPMPVFDSGKSIGITISDPSGVWSSFTAANIDSIYFLEGRDFSTYVLQQSDNNPVMSFNGWSNFHITISDSASTTIFSTTNWSEIPRFNDSGEPLIFDIGGEKISSDNAKWY